MIQHQLDTDLGPGGTLQHQDVAITGSVLFGDQGVREAGEWIPPDHIVSLAECGQDNDQSSSGCHVSCHVSPDKYLHSAQCFIISLAASLSSPSPSTQSQHCKILQLAISHLIFCLLSPLFSCKLVYIF